MLEMPKCMGCIGTQVSEFVLDLCVSAGWWLGTPAAELLGGGRPQN